MNRKFKRTAFV